MFGLVLTAGIVSMSLNAYSGCNNEPSNNDGDCTEANSGGSTSYFCEDSWAFHDCVKVGGGDPVLPAD